jgi:histidyl-tRNA synthetase
VGTKSPSADAEIVILADRTMKVLGLNNFTIKLNNRKILNGFLNSVNFIETDYQTFLRILDKLDKIGWDEIKRELEENLDLKSSVIDEISNFIIRKNDAVSYLKSNYASIPDVQEGLIEIENIMELASASGVTNLQFDLSLARGLEYYTGAVYETKLDDLPALGSVMSGGRYDNLMERFGSDPLPATGISLGVDRLLVGLQELGLVTKSSVIIKVLVIGLGEEMTNQAFKYAGILRDAGIACEVYLGENRNLKKQLDYANRSQIPYCVILGSEEISSNKAKIKEMRTGIQTECSLSGLADYFKMNT